MNFTQPLRTLLLALILSIGISYAYATWSDPTGTPPNINASAPINISSAPQVKGGGGLGDLGVSGVLAAFLKLVVSAPAITGDTEIGSFSAPGTLADSAGGERVAYTTFGGGKATDMNDTTGYGGFVGWDYTNHGIALNAHSAGGSVGGIFVKRVDTGYSNVGIGTVDPIDRLDVRGTRELLHTSGNLYNLDGWGKYTAMGEIARGNIYPTYIPAGSVGFEANWDSDAVFFGMKDRAGSNAKDAVIGWGDDAGDNLHFLFNNADMMTILSDGNVGIGVVGPGEKLEVNGNVKAAGFYYSSSDERLKKDITTLSGALKKILNLRGVQFKWKNGDDSENIGFIAQEVEKVVPQVVKDGSDGMKSLQYGNIVPLLVEAMKEQQKEIELLKTEIEVLKGNR